ncbi:hypothetical protein TcYC6_0056170 [Trypanosoma cruzi]|nr:hypothetical protein TcYC6_0056170 [Trypanosoma cruzi]
MLSQVGSAALGDSTVCDDDWPCALRPVGSCSDTQLLVRVSDGCCGGVRVRPAGDGAVTAGHAEAVMAAEGGPVAGGSGRKGNVNSEDNSNQEDEEGGGNTAGEDHNPTSAGHSLLRRGRINPAATHCEVTLAIRPALAARLLLGCVQVDRSLWAEGTLQAQHPHAPTHLSRQQVECMLVAGGPFRAVRPRNKPSWDSHRCQGRRGKHRRAMKEENPEHNTKPTKPQK